MTSAAEYEAALAQLEEDPPDIRQYNVNIREERWTNFSLEGVRFPAMTVDVIQRGEALAIFERDLIIHFQQISKAAALYVRALLGGVKRALEIWAGGRKTPLAVSRTCLQRFCIRAPPPDFVAQGGESSSMGASSSTGS